ncbi:hypothetical protein EWM64_g8658 [Hericium alpestre]|uniref:Uncharacterized protein n=1 Tax=Hericium alpestre TaxID=135208 RepID=A0A4Y9ZL54_9AGAM|nr:hypothetical protein EWM64_g8658 [Hericium alpestre]
MGKNKRAAKAAWRAAAAATAMLSTASPSPAHSLEMHAPAPDIGELPVRAPQQPRESQMAPAVAARRAQSPAPSLVIEPATPVADATPAFAVEDTTPCTEHPSPLVALSTPTAAAIAALAARVHAAGPPAFFVTTPMHAFDDECTELPVASGSPTSPAPATLVHDPPQRLATTREEIHPDLLAQIMEDGRRIERRAAKLQP